MYIHASVNGVAPCPSPSPEDLITYVRAKHGWLQIAHVKEHGVMRDVMRQGVECSGGGAEIKERCDVEKAVASKSAPFGWFNPGLLAHQSKGWSISPRPFFHLSSARLHPALSLLLLPAVHTVISSVHHHPPSNHPRTATDRTRAPLGETYILPAVRYSKHNPRLILPVRLTCVGYSLHPS